MRNKSSDGWLYLCSLLILLTLCFTSEAGTQGPSRADHQHSISVSVKRATDAQPVDVSSQTAVQPNRAQQPTGPGSGSKKPEPGHQKSETGPRISRERKNEKTKSLREKKQKALLLVDEVLKTTHQIAPVEYAILNQVEAATVLWQIDKTQSILTLKKAVKSLADILGEDKESKTSDDTVNLRRQRLRFLILRKIASLKPELIKDLNFGNSSNDKPAERVNGEWTEEARAIISVAIDQIEKDPKLAAQLAEQSLPFGFVNWTTFLQQLSKRDASEAERLATAVISRLGNSSLDPSLLRDISRFVLVPGRTPALQEYYFQAVFKRLQREFQANTPIHQLQSDLGLMRSMSRLAATHSPRWQPEFENLALAFEAWFNERSIPIPGPPSRKVMDTSVLSKAEAGDTSEISNMLSQITAIRDVKKRDKEYQQLAFKAALKADLLLAEDIVSKIETADIRREAAFMIYSPLVRSAIQESNWAQAQKQALKISDPLGRALVLDAIAQAMVRSREEKLLVKDVYGIAVTQLRRENPTVQIAKAFLMLAKSLQSLDEEASIDAIRSAAYVLNKVAASELLEDPPLMHALATWVRLPNYSFNADEAFDLADMLGAVFKDVAKRDSDEALLLADEFVHVGLRSLAQLAVSRVLLDEVNNSSNQDNKRNHTIPTAKSLSRDQILLILASIARVTLF